MAKSKVTAEVERVSKVFPIGTEMEDIMDFSHDNIKWSKWEDGTKEKVRITIEKL